MPHVYAAIPRELHLEILRLVREGVPRKAVAIDLDLNQATVDKYTAHLPEGNRRDLVRASILRRADAGEYVRTIASLENCTLGFVVRILRAHGAEQELTQG